LFYEFESNAFNITDRLCGQNGVVPKLMVHFFENLNRYVIPQVEKNQNGSALGYFVG
jgi:hypothetical protein